MKEVLDFLNSIEGAGYGGMASFEIARAKVRDVVQPPHSQADCETALLPCPFCGSRPETERTGFSGRALYIFCINDNGCPRPKAIGETAAKAAENWNTRVNQSGVQTEEANPRVVDNDSGDISVSLNGKELRGWSYASDTERRAKMLAAREYVEGWCDGRQA